MTDEKEAGALGRVSRSTAEQILATAANRDAMGEEMVDLQELRTAAEAAGISREAFDTSVAELRRAAAPIVRERGSGRKRVSYMKVMGVGGLGVAGAVAIVAQLPFPNAGVFGAVLAGIGSIGAVVAYLRSALPGKSEEEASVAEEGR